MNFKRLQSILQLGIFFFVNSLVNGQSFVADTLVIPFGNSDPLAARNPAFTVFDYRLDPPTFLSVFEKKKWLVFPVDQIVKLPEPLANCMEKQMINPTGSQKQLVVKEFTLINNKSSFKHTFSLQAAIELSEIVQNGDTLLQGVFYYEKTHTQKAKDSLEMGYIRILNNFNQQFNKDLEAVYSQNTPEKLWRDNHFKQGSHAISKNFYVGTDVFAGYGFWGFDLTLYFSSPEPAQKFSRGTRMFRYLHVGTRQTVGFSANTALFNYRLNTKWLFQNKRNFLLGFNKWSDVDEEKRTFEELFLFQYSMMQRLCYNPMDKKGFTFAIGIMEDASYVIYNKPYFNVGGVVSCFYKF